MLNQFSNLSCYEEFEIQCDLAGISKVDVLKEIGDKVGNYYFFVSNDGIFNWFDLNGNHIEDPTILKELNEEYIPEIMTKYISKYIFPKNITKCIIPNNVTSIRNDVFRECTTLKEITIPNSVTSIGHGAFYGCTSLKEITIPNSVTSIGDGAFYGCTSLKEVTIPNSIIIIGTGIFYACKTLKEIIIPNSVISIGDYAFSACTSLKEVVFKGKTLKEVEQMTNYPFGIKDESIIKCV